MRRMFSEKQIENLIKQMLVNNSQFVKQLIASQNEDVDISEDVEIRDYASLGVTYEKGYIAIRKTAENELYIVCNFSVTNPTESAIAVGNGIFITWNNIPKEIGEKIYDVNGNTVEVASNAGITACMGFTDTGIASAGYYSERVVVANNLNVANTMRFIPRDVGSIPAGATWNFTFRLFLTL